jgi:MFS family permease
MGRTVAVVWHASFSIAAGILYFFFVLPRWPELMGDTSHTVGTVLRIVAGALIALAALPVVFTLLRTRKPEYGTPQLALTLRFWSIVGHVLAGALIIGTAISEIWLSLDDAGQWLFGIYGAAAAVAVLGISAFYLAFVAALPPPPPRPLKAKAGRKRRRRKDGEGEAVAEAAEDGEGEAVAEAAEDGEGEAVAEAAEDGEGPAEATVEVNGAPETADGPELAATGGLSNRRPSGKAGNTRRRRRSTAAPSSD